MESVHGNFVYRDALFADVGEGKRFPRATVADLNSLLLPKSGAASTKDETANFYIAQLIHYGLQKTKDKSTAKLRLTQALSAKKLAVPSDIQKIEADLKKDYATLQRKAKLSAKKGQNNTPNKAAAGQKRKADGTETGSKSSTNTKISVTVGDISFQIDQSSVQNATKRQRKAVEKQEASTPKAKPKKAAADVTKVSSVKATRPNPAPKPSTQSPRPVKAQRPASSAQARPIQTARRIVPFPPRPIGEDEDDAPPAYSEYDDQGAYDHNDQIPRGVQISGEYEIDAPTHDNYAKLKLRLSNPRDQLWGEFFIGDRQGVLRMDHTSDVGGGTRKSFGWRSEDTATGTDLRFGKNCDG